MKQHLSSFHFTFCCINMYTYLHSIARHWHFIGVCRSSRLQVGSFDDLEIKVRRLNGWMACKRVSAVARFLFQQSWFVASNR